LSFIGTYFSEKRARRPNEFFKANQLDIRPKGQLKFFMPTNLKEANFFKFGLEKANLATLFHTFATERLANQHKMHLVFPP